MKKTTNYRRFYKCTTVLLLIITAVIYNVAHDYWKVLMFLPFLAIIILGIWVDKIEEKEERKKSMGIRQHYQYPKK